MWIELKSGWVLLYVYPRHNDVSNHKKPTEDEALDIVRAIDRQAVETAVPATAAILGAAGRKIEVEALEIGSALNHGRSASSP